MFAPFRFASSRIAPLRFTSIRLAPFRRAAYPAWALALLLAACPALAQTPRQTNAAAAAKPGPPTDPAVIATIHRLILTDGSDQAITRYQIKGDRVRYLSAERGGQWEEIPVSLVDWAATENFARAHTPAGHAEAEAQSEAAALDREEQAERAEQKSRTPEVLPGLRLPNQDGIWALDYFHNVPELAPLEQNTGDINERTGHNMIRQAILPLARKKQEVIINGAFAKVRLHEPQPPLYISLTTGNNEPGPNAITVNTQPTPKNAPQAISSPDSKYAIVSVWQNIKKNDRVVSSIDIGALGGLKQSEDIVSTDATVLPGGHWMKITPRQPLPIGEYALIELPAPGEVNLSVWDFAIDPQAPDNQNTILPLQASR